MDKNIDNFLKQSPIFSNLDEKEIEEISKISIQRKFNKGNVIFYEEDKGTSFYLIVSGQVKIVVLSPDGKEHILDVISKNNFFGEISILDGKPRSSTAIALDTVTVITITRDNFLSLLLNNPDICLKIVYVLCHRLRQVDKRVGNLAFLSASGRVASLILHMKDKLNLGEKVINLNMTRQEFANMANTSRETLTRIIMDFKDEGIIEIDKKLIVINDREKLEEKVV